MRTLYLVAGARPNFMKLAPIVRALQADGGLSFKIIHTGQHYDREMNHVFFEELGIPEPDVFMSAGGGSHAQQTSKVMLAFEEICEKQRPSAVLVVGDVNSTLACSIVAKKLNIQVAHVEAGLRSGDMSMPEEVNRRVTDSIADWFFVTEPSAVDNLQREGKAKVAIHYVGNVMVDNLLYQTSHRSEWKQAPAEPGLNSLANDVRARYGVVTLHRPSNVDHRETMQRICDALQTISTKLPLIFPVHPRTRHNLDKFGIDLGPHVTLIGPQSYMGFLELWRAATVVLTDSGGLQEETTALGIPCITLRDNTERPVTVSDGTNVLAGTDPQRIIAEVMKVLEGKGKRGRRPHLWDGKAAERMVQILTKEVT